MSDPYQLAQVSIANLKSAVHMVLKGGPSEEMRNADVGRVLGIYSGHVRHVGHIPRSLLALMESEGVVQQDPKTKLWTLRTHAPDEEEVVAD